MKPYQFFMQSDNKTVEGYAESISDARNQIRKMLRGEQYNINEATIVRCIESPKVKQ